MTRGRKSFTTRLLVVPSALLTFFIANASCSSMPTPYATIIPTQISPNAVPLSNTIAAQAIVEQDRLIFPQTGNAALAALQPGQILTSGVGDGFLRTVTSVASSGANIVIQTQPASLTDVVMSGETSATVDFATTGDDGGTQEDDSAVQDDAGPDDSGATGQFHSHGHHPRDIVLPGFSKTLDGMEIYSNKTLGVSVKITKGSLSFVPSLNVGITIQNSALSMNVVAGGQLSADTHVEVTCTASFAEQTFETDLWPSSPPINVNLPPIGPIPVVASVRLLILGGVQVSCGGDTRLTAGGTTSLTVSYGVQYANGSFQPVTPSAPTWTSDGPTFAAQVDLSTRAYVSAGVELGFFGGLKLPFIQLGAGGNLWVTIDPYLQFNYSSSNAASWGLAAGLQGRYWGNLSVLSKTVASIDPPVVFFDVNTQVAPADDASATMHFTNERVKRTS